MFVRANNETIEVEHASEVPTSGEIRRMQVKGLITRTYQCVAVQGPVAHWHCIVNAEAMGVEVTA